MFVELRQNTINDRKSSKLEILTYRVHFIDIKATPDNNLPKNLTEVEACEYIRIDRNFLDKKFDYTSFLWETSNQFFNKLTYLGCYAVIPPKNECTTRLAGIHCTILSSKNHERISIGYYLSNKDFQF